MLQTNVVATENQNTHLKFDNIFSENRAIGDNVKNHLTSRQATDGNVTQRTQDAICIADN
jgi:hypothetical protein